MKIFNLEHRSIRNKGVTILLHDWISIEPEISSGVLTITDGEVSVGIVKDVGPGYTNDVGDLVLVQGIYVGDKILFTQHMTYEVDGVKLYRVRYRDVIEVLNA